VPLSDAIFANIKDQDSMPCKYYAQFKKATGERQSEVAEKVATMFDMLTDSDMRMMASTDPNLADSLSFKTAVFVNVNDPAEEHSAKIMMTLLLYFVQNTENHAHVLFVLDDLDAKHTLISLPHWMKEASDHNMSFLVINENIAEFKATTRAEKFFRNLQKTVTASVLVHRNEAIIKFSEELPTTYDDMDELMEEECVATVIIPESEISDNDELF
jgi:molybdopterin converting factor small subunit